MMKLIHVLTAKSKTDEQVEGKEICERASGGWLSMIRPCCCYSFASRLAANKPSVGKWSNNKIVAGVTGIL